jgi:Protein of unknown function (DUF1552)
MHLLRKPSISRRTLLRGVAAGTSVAIGLPLLEAMLDAHGEALAGGEPLPKRFVTWLVSNGFLLDRLEPQQTGANWDLSEQLEPLADVKDYVNVCTGFSNHGADAGFVSGHIEGMTVFTGYPYSYGSGFYDAGGPSIDQVVADQIGRTTPVRSLQVAVSKANTFANSGTLGSAISFSGDVGSLVPLPPIASPKAVWESLFGIFPGPGAPDGDRVVRSMMLDAVKAQSESLRGKVGSVDRARIDAHLQGVAELNQKISALAPACVLPDEPDLINAEPVGSEKIREVSEAMSELITYALRCDITRVASVMFLGLAGETPYTEMSATKHSLSHEAQYNATALANLNASIIYEMEQFAYFVKSLRDAEDGIGANLLDSTIVYASSDCSVGWLHSVARQPIILVGTGGGYLKYPGIHVQAVANNENDPNGLDSPYMPTAGNTSDIALACLQAYDPGANGFGGGASESVDPLPDIIA